MKFKNIKISNFRNFEHIDISLDNKNVFFGMNDVGKTNFLWLFRGNGGLKTATAPVFI